MRRTYSKILMITLWLTIAVPVVAMTSSMPVSNGKLSSDFGERCGHYHKGIDISIKEGVVVRSAFDGEIVTSSYNEGGYGNYVVIRHEKGIETLYGHLSKHVVDVGQHVKAGEVIGLAGSTGNSTGVHLHFEVHIDGVAINPSMLFDFESKCVKMVGKHASKEFDDVAYVSSKSQQEDVEEQSIEKQPENQSLEKQSSEPTSEEKEDIKEDETKQPDSLVVYSRHLNLLPANIGSQGRAEVSPLASLTASMQNLAEGRGKSPAFSPSSFCVKTSHFMTFLIDPPPE